jgi:hypothetical protein
MASGTWDDRPSTLPKAVISAFQLWKALLPQLYPTEECPGITVLARLSSEENPFKRRKGLLWLRISVASVWSYLVPSLWAEVRQGKGTPPVPMSCNQAPPSTVPLWNNGLIH